MSATASRWLSSIGVLIFACAAGFAHPIFDCKGDSQTLVAVTVLPQAAIHVPDATPIADSPVAFGSANANLPALCITNMVIDANEQLSVSASVSVPPLPTSAAPSTVHYTAFSQPGAGGSGIDSRAFVPGSDSLLAPVPPNLISSAPGFVQNIPGQIYVTWTITSL